MIAITGRINPDLDAVACAVAYEHYRKQQGINDRVAVFQGNPHPEAMFVCRELGIELKKGVSEEYNTGIMVDFSQKFGLPSFIDPARVIEVIDHRGFPDYDYFPNAKFQIELVGSAATLIAEKFQFNNIGISPEMANVLYCGTLSNTLNFKANVTTFRDYRSADWLISQGAKVELGKQMFDFKTKYIQENLEEVLLEDSKTSTLPNNDTINMMQLELLNGNFLYTMGNITEQLRSKGLLHVDHATIFVQDLELGKTRIYVEEGLKDLFTHKGFEGALVDKFRREMPKLYLRKELIPMINKLCIE